MPATYTDIEAAVIADAEAVQPTDLDGKPYVPARAYRWLTAKARADFSEIFDCAPSEVEYRLDAREAMIARQRERQEYEDPYGYGRGSYGSASLIEAAE